YIHGILLGVDEGRRIVQTWRTSEFPPEARDSRLVVEFEPARGGTRVIVRHSDLPSSHVKKYERGWTEHYLKALARYFAKGAKQRTPAARAPESSWGRKAERPARHPQKAPASSAADIISTEWSAATSCGSRQWRRSASCRRCSSGPSTRRCGRFAGGCGPRRTNGSSLPTSSKDSMRRASIAPA